MFFQVNCLILFFALYQLDSLYQILSLTPISVHFIPFFHPHSFLTELHCALFEIKSLKLGSVFLFFFSFFILCGK